MFGHNEIKFYRKGFYRRVHITSHRKQYGKQFLTCNAILFLIMESDLSQQIKILKTCKTIIKHIFFIEFAKSPIDFNKKLSLNYFVIAMTSNKY